MTKVTAREISAKTPIETAVLSASNHTRIGRSQLNMVFDCNMSYLACDFIAKKMTAKWKRKQKRIFQLLRNVIPEDLIVTNFIF